MIEIMPRNPSYEYRTGPGAESNIGKFRDGEGVDRGLRHELGLLEVKDSEMG